MISYWHSTVTIALSRIISKIKQDTGWKSIFFIFHLHLIWLVGYPSEYCHKVYRKTRMVWLPDGEKFDDMFSRFNTISACDEQTDGQTHRWTDILPLPTPSYAYTLHSKNDIIHIVTAEITCIYSTLGVLNPNPMSDFQLDEKYTRFVHMKILAKIALFILRWLMLPLLQLIGCAESKCDVRFSTAISWHLWKNR